jgi:hypothetical protein
MDSRDKWKNTANKQLTQPTTWAPEFVSSCLLVRNDNYEALKYWKLLHQNEIVCNYVGHPPTPITVLVLVTQICLPS